MNIRDRIETLIYGAPLEERERMHREEMAALALYFPEGPAIPASSNDAIIAARSESKSRWVPPAKPVWKRMREGRVKITVKSKDD